MIKQREKTRVVIFRLANTSLHQVYYEDHEITEISLKICSTTMGDDGGNDVNAWINFPAITNPPPLPPLRHILGHFQPFRAGAGEFF